MGFKSSQDDLMDFLLVIGDWFFQSSDWISLLWPKSFLEKSRGEVSLVGQDTIENVSQPIKFFF